MLEDYFGKPLFVRHANTIALTDHGRALLPSVTTALDTLAAYSGERWLVLGDMAELGADAASGS